MRIYKLSSYSYTTVRIADKEEYEKFVPLQKAYQLEPKSLQDSWIPVLALCDFPRKRTNIYEIEGMSSFAVDKKTKDILAPLLNDSVEFLPFNGLKTEGLHFFNIPTSIDCLDKEKSKIKHSQYNEVMDWIHIQKPVIEEDKLKDIYIFKIKGCIDTFITETFIDIFKANGLEGLNVKDLSLFWDGDDYRKREITALSQETKVWELAYDYKNYKPGFYYLTDVDKQNFKKIKWENGLSLKDKWTTIQVKHFSPSYPDTQVKEWDCSALGIDGDIVINQKAKDILAPILLDAVEFLPIPFEGDTFYFFNVIKEVDCLNHDKTRCEYTYEDMEDEDEEEKVYDPTRPVKEIDFKDPVFDEDKLEGVLVFKVKYASYQRIYVTHLFQQICKENNLEGLVFEAHNELKVVV